MHLLFASRKGEKKNANKFFADEHAFPQTLDLLKTRSVPLGIELVVGAIDKVKITDPDLFAVYVQNPNSHGSHLVPVEAALALDEPWFPEGKEYQVFLPLQSRRSLCRGWHGCRSRSKK